MKVGRGIEPAKSCILEQNAAQRKYYFLGKPNSGLNTRNKESQISDNQKNQEELRANIEKSTYLLSASVGIHSHIRYRFDFVLDAVTQPDMIAKAFSPEY